MTSNLSPEGQYFFFSEEMLRKETLSSCSFTWKCVIFFFSLWSYLDQFGYFLQFTNVWFRHLYALFKFTVFLIRKSVQKRNSWVHCVDGTSETIILMKRWSVANRMLHIEAHRCEAWNCSQISTYNIFTLVQNDPFSCTMQMVSIIPVIYQQYLLGQEVRNNFQI